MQFSSLVYTLQRSYPFKNPTFCLLLLTWVPKELQRPPIGPPWEFPKDYTHS